jgi:hypothetical protein
MVLSQPKEDTGVVQVEVARIVQEPLGREALA